MKPATLVLLALAAAAAATRGSVAQDRMEPVPKPLEHVDIVEKPDAALPLQLTFKDEDGRDVTLGSYFRPGRPVILTLNYFRCPMLCTLELNGLVDAMKRLPFTPAADYAVVTVSFDPREGPALAREKKGAYLSALGRPTAGDAWHFLTGDASAIEALTKAVGFSYAYDEATGQYGHAAAIVVATPGGRVARYFYGVEFPEDTLKLGLLEASRGKIGSTWDRFILYCYHYDAGSGRYAPAALSIMRAAGAFTALVLGAVIGGFWLRDRRHRPAAGA